MLLLELNFASAMSPMLCQLFIWLLLSLSVVCLYVSLCLFLFVYLLVRVNPV